MDKNIVVSIKTILITLLFVLGAYLIYRLSSIIGLLVIALLITIALEQTVQFFSRQTLFNRLISRPLAVLITYLLVFLSISIVISIGLDPVLTQSQKLIQTMSKNKDLFSFGGTVDFSFSEMVSSFVTTSGGVLTATKSIFDNVTALFSILILSIYMSIDWKNIKDKFTLLFPDKKKERIAKLLVEVEQNVGLWLRGQLILMLVIGVMSYIGLVIIGVNFSLALAIMSGLLEIVPIIGPVFSAVIAALVAAVDSPVQALLVILLYIVIQQLENNILVPKVMQKVSGFSPLTILIALLIGGNLFGILGTILAVPILMVSVVVIKSVVKMYAPESKN